MTTTPPDAPAEESAEGTAEPVVDTAQPDDTAQPVDTVRQPVLDALRSTFGNAVLDAELTGGDLCVRVDRSAWRAVATFLKQHESFDYFTFLSAIDWLPSPEAATRYEKVWGAIEEDEDGADGDDDAEAVVEDTGGDEDVPLEMRHGVTGGDTRFQVFCRLYSVGRRIGITLKADLDDEEPTVDSLVPVYRGADWQEREAWEMFGIEFTGHPRLRHIYLPGDFEGRPLRKDFPLLAREVKPWPGLVNVEALPAEPAAAEPAADEPAVAEPAAAEPAADAEEA
jgi:NADH-quinone oxidoreductase subunit C